MKELAESDVKEVVQTVQEIFADYNPYSGKPTNHNLLKIFNAILAHLFTIPLNKMNPFQIDETDLRRSSEGLMALLLSLSLVFKMIHYS